MINDSLAFTGRLEITVIDEKGQIKSSIAVPNLVVNQGKAFIMQRLLGTATTGLTHMGVGIGTAVPVAADTDLQAATGPRSATTALSASITTTNDSVRYQATFGSAVVGAITEAGLFSSSTGPSLCCRTTFLPINKTSTDTLTIVWILTANVPE